MQIPATKAAATTTSPPLASGTIAPSGAPNTAPSEMPNTAPSAVPKAVPNGTPGPATATLGATAAKMPTTHLLIFILTLQFETSVAPFTNPRSLAHSANFGELSRAQFPCRKRLSVVNQVQSSGRTGTSPSRRKVFRQSARSINGCSMPLMAFLEDHCRVAARYAIGYQRT